LCVDGLREQSSRFVRAGDVAAPDLDLSALRACDLTAGEERATELARRVDDRTARVEDLSDARSSLRKPRIVLTSKRSDVVCALAQALVDRPIERVAESDIEEQTRGREHDGHRNRECEGEAKTNRYRCEPAHDVHPPPSARRR
jgi:hypothetical protein